MGSHHIQHFPYEFEIIRFLISVESLGDGVNFDEDFHLGRKNVYHLSEKLTIFPSQKL